MKPDSNINLSPGFQLVHATRYRLRFRSALLAGQQQSVKTLLQQLATQPGVDSIRVNHQAASLTIHLRNAAAAETVKQQLQDFSASQDDIHIIRPETLETPASDNIPPEWRSAADLILAGGALLLEAVVPGPGLKTAITGMATAPLMADGAQELVKKGLTSRVLESTAVGVSMYQRDYLAANATNVMLALGEYIEDTMVQRSDDLLRELAKPSVEEAWLEQHDGDKVNEVLVKTAQLKTGDIVVVGAGATIPVDGHVVGGEASVNQVSMTGEAEPIRRQRGDSVIAGTVIEEGRLRVWAEQVGSDTSTQRIKQHIQHALEEKSNSQLQATQLADRLVPATLGLAGLSFLISGNFNRVAAVLQADYSCALKLATPVAFKSALSRAGHHGILVKGATALETLNDVDTLLFDKTGTLTQGKLEVVRVDSYHPEWSVEQLLNLAASAEEHYFHPVAEAVVRAAKQRGFVHMHHEAVEFVVAHGVKTEIDGKTLVIGSRHFLQDDEGVDFEPHKESLQQAQQQDDTLLYVGYGGELLGIIALKDQLRDNAEASIKELRQLGIKRIVMLSGDAKDKAETVAQTLGLDEVHAELLPEDKAQIVKEYTDAGHKVAFIGDGINDAPALVAANVGISMGGGADIARAAADICLLRDDLDALVEARHTAQATMALVKQNFRATVTINSGILAGASLGIFNPITTAVLHNGTTLMLLLNAIKGPKRRTEKEKTRLISQQTEK